MNLWVIGALVALAIYLLMPCTKMETFSAPYYIPWWRRYSSDKEYGYPGLYPYYNSRWYFWPYYGKESYDRYWYNYNVQTGRVE